MHRPDGSWAGQNFLMVYDKAETDLYWAMKGGADPFVVDGRGTLWLRKAEGGVRGYYSVDYDGVCCFGVRANVFVPVPHLDLRKSVLQHGYCCFGLLCCCVFANRLRVLAVSSYLFN